MLTDAKKKQYLDLWDEFGHFSVEESRLSDAIVMLETIRTIREVKVKYNPYSGMFSIEKV